MSRSAPRQMADLVGARGEVGDLLARFDAAPHALGRLGEFAHRLGDGVGERQRQHQHHRRQHQEEAQQRPALRGDDRVDVAALGRQQQRAANRVGVALRSARRPRRSSRPRRRRRRIDSVLPSSAAATSGSDLPLVTHSSAARRLRAGVNELRRFDPGASATTADPRRSLASAAPCSVAPRADSVLRIEQQQPSRS